MLLKPNLTVKISSITEYDSYGQPVIGPEKQVKCRVVKYRRVEAQTSVRTDSSATRGRSEEMTFDAVLLFDKNVTVNIGDVITVFGQKLIAAEIESRLNIKSQLDHWEVRLKAWA